MRRSVLHIMAVMAAVLLVNCSGSAPPEYREDCPNETPTLAPPPAGVVADTLTICGGRYVVEAHPWRDFMPIAPPDGDPLRIVVTLSETDSLAAPAILRLEHLWVIHGDDFWSTDFNDEKVDVRGPHQVAAIARCGPKWAPGDSVDVIVSLRCGADSTRYVRASRIPILQTI